MHLQQVGRAQARQSGAGLGEKVSFSPWKEYRGAADPNPETLARISWPVTSNTPLPGRVRAIPAGAATIQWPGL